MKENVSYYVVFSVVMLLIFILIIAMVVAIPVAIVNEVKIFNVPIKYGYVTSMDDIDRRMAFPKKVPTVKISYDITYKGKLYTYVKTYNITAEQYARINCGDIIYFDDNNMPIFPSSSAGGALNNGKND